MLKRIAPLAALLIALVIGAGAQATSQLSGTISATDGSVIPGAQVQITNVATNAVRTAQSDAHGGYVFRNLPVGSYTLSATLTGFQKFVQSGITLVIGSSPVVNVTLQVGQASQTVEVHSNASMVSQVSSGVGQVIQPEQIADLPLNARQVTDLIGLSGGAVASTAGGLNENLDVHGSVSYSIAGSQINSTEYQLDGAPNMDYRTNVGSPLPFPDALQEFRVSSSAQPANRSSRPGGDVSALTKSGTNQFHGDLFEYVRNGSLDAETTTFQPNATTPAPAGIPDNLKRNQFGGTIGGPILHNKLFFFYGYQGTLTRAQNPARHAIVPTAAMLQGDFTAFLSTPCQRTQQYLNDTVPDPNGGAPQQLTTAHDSNILLPAWLSTPSAQITAKIAKLLPTPIDACGDTFNASSDHENEYQHIGRVDWQRTASDTLFARYFLLNYTQLSTLASGQTNILSSSGDGLANRFQSVVLGDTHTFGPQWVNSFRLSFSRSAVVRTSNPAIPTICDLGAVATCEVPNMLRALYLEPGFLGYDFENMFGLTETLGWQTGAHYVTFGFSGQMIQMNADGEFQQNPNIGFVTGSSSYTGQQMADFVTGNVDSFSQGNGQIGRDQQLMPAVFFNDNWSITPHFNLSYGLRWQPFYPQFSRYNYASDFTMAGYTAGTTSKVFTNAPPGVTFNGDPGSNGKSDTNSAPWNFAPNVGFSWDPSGHGAESIHGGYGMSYDTSIMWNTMHVVLNPPWGFTLGFNPLPVNVTTPASGGGLANMFYNQAGGNPFPTPHTLPANYPFPNSGTYVFESQNYKPARTQQWNLGVEKQFGANWLLSATYLGSKTSNISAGVNLDPSTVITAGMTAPGIVSTAGMSGTSGPCTLNYLGTNVTFPTCNSSGHTVVNGVNNENARKALTLANPLQGPKFNGGLVQAQPIGYANYNGLLLTVQHRLSNGLSISSNYTWSHCLDNASVGQDIGNAFMNPSQPALDYGNCGTDRRQSFNLSFIAQSPSVGSGIVRAIVSNWTTSEVFTASTGAPFTVAAGQDNSLTGVGADRPNVVSNPFVAGQVSANPTCSAPSSVYTRTSWYNPCAFMQTSTPGVFGNEAVNQYFGPGNWNINSALFRTFDITEGRQLVFRAEAFNVLNHPQIGNPSTTLTSSTVGLIGGTAGDNRIIQLAMIFKF